MKIKNWYRTFQWAALLTVCYLVLSAVPPMVVHGVFIGGFCLIIYVSLLLYCRRLIKTGRGDERRP